MVALRGGKNLVPNKAGRAQPQPDTARPIHVASAPVVLSPSAPPAAPSPARPQNPGKSPAYQGGKPGRTPSSDLRASSDAAAKKIDEVQGELSTYRNFSLQLKKETTALKAEVQALKADVQAKEDKIMDLHVHAQLLEARHVKELKNLEAKMASLKQAHAIEIKEVRLQARFANKAAAPRAPQPPPPPPPEDDGEEEDDENEEDEVARAADDDDGDAGDAEQLELLDQLALGRPSSLSATKRPRAEQQAAAADESESETERPAKRRAAVDALHALTPQGVQDLDESDDAELDNSKDADYQREEADEEAAAEDNESSEDVLKKSRRARSAFVKALPRKAGGTSRSPQKEDGTLPLRVPFSIREKQAIIKGAIKHNIFANQKADWKSILTDKTLDFHPKRDTVAIKDCYRNILKTYYKNDRALLLQDTEARAILGANAAAAAAQDDESE